MMDLSLTYLCVGGEPPPPVHSPFSPWAQKGAVKELPLVGQLSLPKVDNVYPFLLLNGFSKPHKKPQTCHPSRDDMNPQSEDSIVEDNAPHNDPDSVSAGYGVVELPLLWQHPSLQQGDHPPLFLDGSIWRNLPRDLLEKIAAFLHVPDAVRLCVVSKLWNSFPYSPPFRKTFTESHIGGSSTLMFQCDSLKHKLQTPWLAMYDTVDNRWYSMSLSFLPDPPLVPFMNYTVVAASGGLLCMWPEPQKTWKSVGFIVCNPVTRSWKELPCRSQDNRLPDFVAMHVHMSRGSYKILVVTESVPGSHLAVTTELYDSESCKWKLLGTEPVSGGKFKSMVVSAGKVYFVCAQQQWFKIKVFDMEEQRWGSFISAPTFFYETQEEFGAPEVLDCNGRLLLVGRVGKYSSKEEVIIWELESSVNSIDSWREVDRMPQDISREFLGCLVFGHYYCISRGDQIFFIASFKAPMLTYNTLKRAWSWWAWPFYEKYADRFPIFGFVKALPAFPPFGFAFDLHFGVLA
ncbi:hypothetical protein L7F22_007575 [Adiantum nelumboides]|nr:hypothetical protein [Adiantum nelumboides]